MRILDFLTDPEPVRTILRHLDLPATPPALSPARSPPQPDLGLDLEHTLDLDQTPAFDPTEPEPVRTPTSIRAAAPERRTVPHIPLPL